MVKVGVLGYGPIARHAHLEACRKAKNIELWAVCNAASDLAKKMGGYYEVMHVFTDFEEMLAYKGWYCDSTHRYGMTDSTQSLPFRSTQSKKPIDNPKDNPRKYFMMAYGSHLLDTARFLAGSTESIQAGLVEKEGMYCWFMDSVQNPWLKIIFNPVNLFEMANDAADIHKKIEEGIDSLAGGILVAHAKDRKADAHVVCPGRGIVDFGFYIKKLRNIGFQGSLVLHGLPEKEVLEAKDFLGLYME